jgi:hypothetical protein
MLGLRGGFAGNNDDVKLVFYPTRRGPFRGKIWFRRCAPTQTSDRCAMEAVSSQLLPLIEDDGYLRVEPVRGREHNRGRLERGEPPIPWSGIST